MALVGTVHPGGDWRVHRLGYMAQPSRLEFRCAHGSDCRQHRDAGDTESAVRPRILDCVT